MGVLYNNKLINTEKSVTNEDILEIEKKYSFKFPNDFRDHYLTFNGGDLERYIFKDEHGYKYVVQCFIPIKYGGRTLENVLDILRVDPILPEWLIPFADDPGGDQFCFSLKEDDIGAVYYWSHEYEYGDDPEEHVWYLAKSLKVFIESMIDDV